MSITIDQLPPEIQALIGAGTNRSPVRQPLTDLREPADPKAKLNRPNFFFEMGKAEPYRYQPYPALRYKLVNGRIEERRVENATEDNRAQADGWADVPPYSPPPTVEQQKASEVQAIKESLAEMTPEERQQILAAYAERRRQTVLDRLSAMPDEEFAKLQWVEEPEPKGRR